jgi:DNA invertase Pin-like site-specific DNA recombinase
MKPPLVRCAIYTRKSSEEGLDQAFNSLDAQREACEAYVLSQTGEGWSALKDRYDDGGISGGTLERPALKRLLADIAAGKVDTVVVYKIDRLTRSLNDFARIVDVLDKAGASFVSVTQAFNTTTSMGRLTLNVLLSFAQFEREVTGERIRDKIAASKAKGMWMGGNPPLGYDPPTDKATRSLVLNEPEAETVRLIFRRYLELGSVNLLARSLAADGVRSKAWISTRGRAMGGQAFTSGALRHLLKNRIYLGEIVHKDAAYPNAHPSMIDADLFDAVQARLAAASGRERRKRIGGGTGLLTGIIFDAMGRPMSPTISYGRGGRCYRYYVSAPLQKGATAGEEAELRRLPGATVDDFVVDAVTRLTRRRIATSDLRAILLRVEVHEAQIRLTLDREGLTGQHRDLEEDLATLSRRLETGERAAAVEADPSQLAVAIAVRLKTRGGRSWMVMPNGAAPAGRGRIDQTLVWGLSRAHSIVGAMALRPDGRAITGQAGKAAASPYERAMAGLTFLAPDIQAAIIAGRQPAALKLEHILRSQIPLAWADQRALYGF